MKKQVFITEPVLSPSILSADFWKLGDEITAAVNTGAKYIHVDVMDGIFVPQISFANPIITSLKTSINNNVILDVHLMVEEPDRMIESIASCGADIITVHMETCRHLDRTIGLIHSLGKKAGVALNPGTSLHTLDYILDQVDMVLIMTVNPGFGGQTYIPYCDKKIKDLRSIIKKRQLHTKIEVDGGVGMDNIQNVRKCGADIFVCGSAVFHGDIQKNVKELLEKIN